MKFHLDYTPKKPPFSLAHHQALFLAGSCFSTHIGERLREHRFDVFQNPSGIVFNPLSLAAELRHVLDGNITPPEQLLERNGVFYSYQHHSSFHAKEKNALSDHIKQARHEAKNGLQRSACLFITLGSAYYYHHNELDLTVTNCHKQPSHFFEKRLASVQEITTEFKDLYTLLRKINPGLPIVFTVSPVKHLKDGLEENNVSKATLLLAVHKLVSELPNTWYFPAYELVNDDLRDYRFYKSDLAHPNSDAIDYVWEKFSDCFFTKHTRDLNTLIASLRKAESHHDLNGSSVEKEKHQQYLENLRLKISEQLAISAKTS